MVLTNAQREFPEIWDRGSLVGDIITNALAGADWYGLADSWLESVAEDARFA
jgi:hypothetical protein